MKTMTCNQLGGACELAFSANTFDDIAEQSKQHGMEMFQQQDAAHLAAMEKMKSRMQDPAAMNAWFEEKKQQFAQLPDE